MQIDELVVFKPKTKAVAEDVNNNFEKLRVSNNEQEEFLNKLQKELDDYKATPLCEIQCDSNILELNEETNNFKVSGSTPISNFIGITNGIAFIEFTESRIIENSPNLRLQNNVDRVTKPNDIGAYLFEDGLIKEINYFTSVEEKTNTLPTQTIIDAPKDENGKSDFLRKVEFSDDIMPILEDFENDDCLVSSSSQYDAVSYMAWKAFRHHTNDTQGWLTVTGVPNGWLKIEFKNRTPKVTAFAINARNAADINPVSPGDFIMEGSNDDTNWTLLGEYLGNNNWLQNEKRFFALTTFGEFKYYRITINKPSGAGAYVGFGALELFETINNYEPTEVELLASIPEPIVVNTGLGRTNTGKINQLSTINSNHIFQDLQNNAYSYLGYKRNAENRLEPFSTTARPVYASTLQRHSQTNSIPTMISLTTSKEFKSGYVISASSFYAPKETYPAYLAFNKVWNNKWVASVVGGNQWLQIDFPDYRKVARFSIVASHDDAGGSISNGYIKGFNGEEWIVLKEIVNELGWTANEVRNFDADVIVPCNKFRIEFTEIQNMATRAQVGEFEIYELADCFVVPKNKFYSYNIETGEFVETERIYVGRAKSEHNYISDIQCYAIESKYISEEVDLAISTLYSFFHNTGIDYKYLKIAAWIKDKVNGFVLPWNVDSNIESNVELNNYGYYINDCEFQIRTPATIMNYKDPNNVTRAIKGNVSLILQIERSF